MKSRLVGRLFRRLFCKTEPEPRHRCFPPIDNDPGIERRPADAVFACDTCGRRNADPPELCVITNRATGEKSYHVRCPKCWKATGFFATEEEAIKAWDDKKRFRLEG